MLKRIPPLLWLGLMWLVVACDKVPKDCAKQVGTGQGPRVSHAVRSAGEPTTPQSPEQLRARMRQAREIGPAEERNKAIAAVVWEAMDLEPDLAREGFHDLIAGSVEKNRLIRHFAMRMAEQDVEEAARWAAGLGKDEEKSLAFGGIAVTLAENDPERAANLLSDSGVAGRDFDVAVVQVIQRWAAESPEKAAAWVAQFDAGQARSDAMKAVVAAWAMNDPQAVMNWIETIRDPAIHGEAVLGMSQVLLDQPADRQREWLRLAPPELRSLIGR